MSSIPLEKLLVHQYYLLWSVHFHLNFGHILWILSLVSAIRLIDNNDILKATPTTILARFLFIHLKVNCILYNYCKLLVNSNQLNIVLSDSVKYKSFIQSMYSISKRGSMSSRFFGLVASLGNVVDLTRFNGKMIVSAKLYHIYSSLIRWRLKCMVQVPVTFLYYSAYS